MAKYRYGFISNSSSTSFVIYNKSGSKKSWGDFLKEARVYLEQIIADEDLSEYVDLDEEIMENATRVFAPHEVHAFDVSNESDGFWQLLYYLDGGETHNFKWGPESIIIKGVQDET